MSNFAIDISKRFQKLFSLGQIETDPAVERHLNFNHAKLVPLRASRWKHSGLRYWVLFRPFDSSVYKFKGPYVGRQFDLE